MLGLPQPGDSVKFRVADGRRVPIVGRKGFYEAEREYTERWTQNHYARVLDGSLLPLEWEGVPDGQPDKDVARDEAAEKKEVEAVK